jgi:hypothetical protein
MSAATLALFHQFNSGRFRPMRNMGNLDSFTPAESIAMRLPAVLEPEKP